jgi:hypothetical protein
MSFQANPKSAHPKLISVSGGSRRLARTLRTIKGVRVSRSSEQSGDRRQEKWGNGHDLSGSKA